MLALVGMADSANLPGVYEFESANLSGGKVCAAVRVIFRAGWLAGSAEEAAGAFARGLTSTGCLPDMAVIASVCSKKRKESAQCRVNAGVRWGHLLYFCDCDVLPRFA